MGFDWEAWLAREEERIAGAVPRARDLGGPCYQLCMALQEGDADKDFVVRATRRLWWASMTGKTLQERRSAAIYDPALGGVA